MPRIIILSINIEISAQLIVQSNTIVNYLQTVYIQLLIEIIVISMLFNLTKLI